MGLKPGAIRTFIHVPSVCQVGQTASSRQHMLLRARARQTNDGRFVSAPETTSASVFGAVRVLVHDVHTVELVCSALGIGQLRGARGVATRGVGDLFSQALEVIRLAV